ncbi:unnamed protein product [Scytosiphon promiscuus]
MAGTLAAARPTNGKKSGGGGDDGNKMGEVGKPKESARDEESGLVGTAVSADAALEDSDKVRRQCREGSHDAHVHALAPAQASSWRSTTAGALTPAALALVERKAGGRNEGDAPVQQGDVLPTADPPGRYRVLAIHTSAVVLGLATWFSATAVSGQLKERWGIGDTASSVLTSSVNIGFVVGAVLQSIFNAADLVRPQMLYFMGCVGAAAWNALVAAPVNYATAVVLRFLTGASLSLVYPPSLKLISTWFKYRRGVALGTIIGGLSLGSALPHLIVGAGGVGDRWRIVTYATSLLALVSGFLVLSFVPTGKPPPHRPTPAFHAPLRLIASPGPFPFSKAKFSLQTVPRLARNRGVVLATLGYCTHMWELYGLWTWFLSLYTDYLEQQGEAGLGGRTDELSRKRLASLVTFSVVGIGGVGCVFIGWIAADVTPASPLWRCRGRARPPTGHCQGPVRPRACSSRWRCCGAARRWRSPPNLARWQQSYRIKTRLARPSPCKWPSGFPSPSSGFLRYRSSRQRPRGRGLPCFSCRAPSSASFSSPPSKCPQTRRRCATARARSSRL